MRTPAIVLIPSLLAADQSSNSHSTLDISDFEPVHPLARKLRDVLSSPEKSTIGDMAELIEQVMGELSIMGGAKGGLPPPPQPMPAPDALTELPEGTLTDDETTALGQILMAAEQKRAAKAAEAA